MNNKHHIATGLGSHSVKSFGKLLDVKPGETTPVTVVIGLFLAIIGLATFLGHNFVRIIFRKTPIIDDFSLFLSVVCFSGLVWLSVYIIYDKESGWIGSPDSYIVTGVLLIFLSIAFIIKAFKYRFRKSSSEDESILVTLKNEGWNQASIKNLGEPFLVLLLGLFYGFYNLFGGGFLVFCAVSQGIHILFDQITGKDSLAERIDTQNLKTVDDEYNSIQ